MKTARNLTDLKIEFPNFEIACERFPRFHEKSEGTFYGISRRYWNKRIRGNQTIGVRSLGWIQIYPGSEIAQRDLHYAISFKQNQRLLPAIIVNILAHEQGYKL